MTRGTRIDKQLAATILVYALYNGDKQTAKDNGIVTQTIYNYRKALETDTELRELFIQKRQQAEAEWIDSGKDTMLTAIAFIRRCALEMELTADNAYSIAGALKIVSEVTATHKLIDLRIDNARRANLFGDAGQNNRALASGPTIIVTGGSE